MVAGLHGAFLADLAHSLWKAGIGFYGGGQKNRSRKRMFSNLIQICVGADERTQRKLKGIIADLRMDFTSVTASAPGGSDAASSLLGFLRMLCDAKTLACGDAYTPFSAAHLSDRETFPIEKRARRRFLNNRKDLRFCRLRGRFSIFGIWLVQLLPWLRFRVLHVDAEKNWA
jgi:hypothetical protein